MKTELRQQVVEYELDSDYDHRRIMRISELSITMETYRLVNEAVWIRVPCIACGRWHFAHATQLDMIIRFKSLEDYGRPL